MSTLDQLMERNRVTVTVDGMDFLCHRPSAVLAIEAFGAGCLMVVNEGTPEQSVAFDPDKVGDQYEVMRKYLTAAMISPRLGKADNFEDDTISWRSLGDIGPGLYNELMNTTQADVTAFPESSEVQVE
ncbi:MAG: hypothetical protein DRQ62_15400 [Gammaproteobacteria bacterium]|nr:MAG: hypothetical protein DRQ62_15400 [Gammaproteobacteria bacterium]